MPGAPPIKTSWYYILLTLSAEPRHGLEIAREAATLSRGGTRLWPAALYGAIEALADLGWIEELVADKRRPADASDRKRIYALTAPGRKALTAETDRLEALVRTARAIEKSRSRGHA